MTYGSELHKIRTSEAWKLKLNRQPKKVGLEGATGRIEIKGQKTVVKLQARNPVVTSVIPISIQCVFAISLRPFYFDRPTPDNSLPDAQQGAVLLVVTEHTPSISARFTAGGVVAKGGAAGLSALYGPELRAYLIVGAALTAAGRYWPRRGRPRLHCMGPKNWHF